MLRKKWKSVDWIHLPQDSDQRWSLVNTEIKFRFHKRREISRTGGLNVAFRYSTQHAEYGVKKNVMRYDFREELDIGYEH
jgi:hypothetical protein